MLWKIGCAAGALWLAQVGEAQAPVVAGNGGARYAITASAISATLAEAGLPVAESRLHLPGPLTAHTEAPRLKVTVAEQRPNGSLEVRFACQTPAACMPFFVTVDAVEDRPALAAFAARPWATHEAGTPSVAGITVGARVTLELADAQMHIQLPAVAIDTGAPGAEVRVASLDRRHTWRGVVVDATTVRGGVQ